MTTMIERKALVRYHGGKHALAAWILGYFPRHRVYVEPFGGAASVLLRKARSEHEIYNDIDGEIVNLFRVLRDPEQAAELQRALWLTPYARAEYEQSREPSDDPVEQARRTIIRSRQGHGSNSLTNTSGWRIYTRRGRNGSIPGEWAGLPVLIDALVERLHGVFIEQRPAIDVMQRHDEPDTLHYVDPPYVHATRSLVAAEYKHGYKHEMSDDDHCELAACLHGLRGMVVLSGYRCALYDELFGDWQRVDLATYADGARPRVESLWLNPAAQAAQAAPTLFDFAS